MMSAHISEELPRLLTGDATRGEVQAAAEHLRACPDCQQELVSAVVAHAALSSAQRFAPRIIAAPQVGPKGEADSPGEPAPGPLPDLSDVFAQVRKEAMAPAATSGAGPAGHHRRRWVALGAAAAVLVGGGVTYALVQTDEPAPSSRSVALDPYGVGKHPATMTITGNQMTLDATKLPRLDRTRVYEVWLTNNARTKLQSVATVGSDNKAVFTVAPAVLQQYGDIEVSVQPADKLDYSGISVLRGDYD